MRLERRSAPRRHPHPRVRRTALAGQARQGRVAGVVLAVGLAGVLPITAAPSATADPTPSPGGASGSTTPSQAQVDRAGRAVTAKQRSVAAIQSALTAASGRLEAASSAAEQAAESYNGAMWRLSVARSASTRAKAQAARAAAKVARQRAGIVTLVTQSYQDGTELGTASALMSKEGPRGLMNRYGVVQSAGESMDARYAEFRAVSREARRAAAGARAAQARQSALAASAQQLAVGAAQAATAAGTAAQQIAGEQRQLVRELATAQHVSVALATRRQSALAEEARRRAAAAARAKAAQQARLARLAELARQR
ncbi:MAG: hypothetical protein JWR20_437, partial [Marmoricola sp.]|nr:hypothetical protein [Marmoricola sp.]